MKERINYPRKRPVNNWCGRVQGRLTFGKPSHFIVNESGRNGYWYYHAKCECGKKTIIAARKTTQSCGCLRIEACRDAKAGRSHRLKTDRITHNRRMQFDQSTCQQYYPCDNISNRGDELPPACFGDRCYRNEKLAIGNF